MQLQRVDHRKQVSPCMGCPYQLMDKKKDQRCLDCMRVGKPYAYSENLGSMAHADTRINRPAINPRGGPRWPESKFESMKKTKPCQWKGGCTEMLAKGILCYEHQKQKNYRVKRHNMGDKRFPESTWYGP